MTWTLERLKAKGQPYGDWIMKFTDARGRIQRHTLGTTIESEARAKAGVLYEMLTSSARPQPAAVTPAPAAAPAQASAAAPGSGLPLVSKVQDAWARFAAPPPAAPGALAPSSPTPGTPAAAADPEREPLDPARQRRMVKMFARTAFRVDEIIGGLAIKTFTDKLPDRADEDDEKTLLPAWELAIEDAMKNREYSPWWVIGFGSVGMWLGMYRDGAPKPKKPAEVLQLHQGGAPARAEGGEPDGGKSA